MDFVKNGVRITKTLIFITKEFEKSEKHEKQFDYPQSYHHSSLLKEISRNYPEITPRKKIL